ncbi:MAG TPA: hypothetical protein VG652_03185 [Gaiellaceae bacterium]|nr:hypothetical protein [Gaiellaceae bacterium]
MSEAVAAGVAVPSLIPRRLLLLPAVALTLLVIGVSWNREWPLDFLHVFFGGLWTGADLFAGFLIGPIARRLDPPVRRAFMQRYMPRMMVLMPTLALVTLVAGWQLARETGVLTESYPRHWWLVASFVIVGVMATINFALLLPANLQVLSELRKEIPNAELIGRLMGRYTTIAAVIGCLQVATIVVMSRLATF